MKGVKALLVFVFLLVLQGNVFSITVIDSLRQSIEVEKDDSIKFYSIMDLSTFFLQQSVYDSAFFHAEIGYYLAKDRLRNYSMVATSLLQYGEVLNSDGEYNKSIELLRFLEKNHNEDSLPLLAIEMYYKISQSYTFLREVDSTIYFLEKVTSLAKRHPESHKLLVAAAYNNLGNAMTSKGDYSAALVYFHEALTRQTALNKMASKATTLSNIGGIYARLGDYRKAKEYIEKSIQIRESEGEMYQIYVLYLNMAAVGGRLGQFDIFFKNVSLAKNAIKTKADSTYLSMIHSFEVTTYIMLSRKENQFRDSVLQYYDYTSSEINENFLSIDERIKKSFFLVESYANKYNNAQALLIAKKSYIDYFLEHDKQKAVELYKELLSGDISLYYYDRLEMLSGLCLLLRPNKKQEAYRYLKQYVTLKEKNSIEIKAALGQQEEHISFVEKSFRDSIVDREKQLITDEKIKWQLDEIQINNWWILLLIIGVFVSILLFSWLYFQNTRIHRWNQLIVEQNRELSDDKKQLSKYNEEISSSIYYASKIQQALMAKAAKKYYHPKDVVGGVIYWKYRTEENTVHLLLDTYHHGVPGALLTIVGVNIMQQLFRKGGQDFEVLVNEFYQIIKERLSRSKETIHKRMGVVLVKESVGSFEAFGDNELVLVGNAGKWCRWGGEALNSFVIVSSLASEKMLTGSFSTDFKLLAKEMISFQEEDVLFVRFNRDKK